MQSQPVALVTGANQGIGLQIAKDLVTHGFTVLVGSRNLERGEAAAREVGRDAHALQLDVTDQVSITAAAERVRNEIGRLDVLIQNAAISNTKKLPEWICGNGDRRGRRARGGTRSATRPGGSDGYLLAHRRRDPVVMQVARLWFWIRGVFGKTATAISGVTGLNAIANFQNKGSP